MVMLLSSMTSAKPPVIVVGMHRSGTTLAVQLLERLGVYAGRDYGSNREARVFKNWNKWLFKQLSATWDRPENATFINVPQLEPHMLRVLEQQVGLLGAVRFLGPARGLRVRDMRRIDFPWAWKDPRNCFTVGAWKRMFPAAKMLHIYRHPLDVAGSLKRREEKRLARFELSMRTRYREAVLEAKQLYCHSFRLLDPMEGVGLWQQYVNAALTGCAPFESETLHCRYETLLEKPEETLGKIVDFLELNASPDGVARAVENVNPSRAFAHRKDPELSMLMAEVSQLPLVRKFSYEAAET